MQPLYDSKISRYGLTVEAHCRNQPNKHCISHYFCFKSRLNQSYISNKTEHFSYKGGCDTHVLRHLCKRGAGLGYNR